MTSVVIREARITDAEAICTLSKTELGYDYPLQETRKKLGDLLADKKNKVFVAVTDDQVVGYIHASDYDVLYYPTMKNIMGIAVDSRYRRLGIGKKLLAEVEGWAKETGACGVRLVSGAERNGAHEFYRRCGYKGEKQQLNFKKMF